MDIIINETVIKIETKEEKRAVFINSSPFPYFMTWNIKEKKWEFEKVEIPQAFKEIENRISQAIEMSEEKNQTNRIS